MMNSIGRQNPKLGGKKSYNPAFLNPSDMERFGVLAGDIIRIHSLHGEILGVAESEPHLRMGTLSMSHSYGQTPDKTLDPQGQGGCTPRPIHAKADFDPTFGHPRMGQIPVSIAHIETALTLHPAIGYA